MFSVFCFSIFLFFFSKRQFTIFKYLVTFCVFHIKTWAVINSVAVRVFDIFKFLKSYEELKLIVICVDVHFYFFYFFFSFLICLIPINKVEMCYIHTYITHIDVGTYLYMFYIKRKIIFSGDVSEWESYKCRDYVGGHLSAASVSVKTTRGRYGISKVLS